MPAAACAPLTLLSPCGQLSDMQNLTLTTCAGAGSYGTAKLKVRTPIILSNLELFVPRWCMLKTDMSELKLDKHIDGPLSSGSRLISQVGRDPDVDISRPNFCGRFRFRGLF